MTKGKCILKYRRSSTKKLVPILDLIRGRGVEEAQQVLFLVQKRKAALYIEKAIKAAVASCQGKGGESVSPDELYISKAKADTGPILKRIRPGWRGRANMILKRTTHITIEVSKKLAGA